ncbi:MAG: HTTM domain-containing protein [Chloroflexi bacterium]|nr:HTTM domain-containing protein [Chloroflexota bacterium]MCC6892983.1 HTTM domain-containing protein [Anaerolineae bacterium]
MNRPHWLFSSADYNFLKPAYWFGDVDARPLGLFRIAFALLILKEAIYHLFVAEVWYSDAGMLPARLLTRVAPNMPTLMSPFSDTWMAMVFFGLWVVVALLLLLGWQTRVMSVLNWVLLISVINRNPLVATGADSVMQAFAFWSLFLPLGRAYALDARRRGEQGAARVFAFPVRMLQIQIALIYIFTTIFKLQGQTWQSGDALYMAMQVRMHTFPVAEWLLANASISVLRTVTYMALLIEGGFALLVFFPLFQPYLRATGLIAGIGLHVGIALVMNIPNFPLVMITGYLVLIDPRWLDWFKQRGRTRSQTPLMLPVPATAPEPAGCAATLAGIPAAMGKGAYRALLAAVLIGAMGSIIWANILSDDLLAVRLRTPAMPMALEQGLRAVGLWESWAMFAPDPLRFEGWFGLNGIFSGEGIRDVRNPTDRPHWYVGPEARWGKLEENLMTKDKDDPLFSAWAVYTCRQYLDSGITGLEIVLYSRATSIPGQPFLPYQTTVIRGASCIG